MKLDPNMEIDRLLQRQSRRGTGAPVSNIMRQEGDGKDGREAHMDADELSAYAENALPPPARARYMSHLADCDACRKLVTELVVSSGIAGELEKPNAAPQASTYIAPARTWRMRLAALFAPHALRYATSVILIVGVVAIAFMVFRGRQMKFDSLQPEPGNVSTTRNDDSQGGSSTGNDTGGTSNDAPVLPEDQSKQQPNANVSGSPPVKYDSQTPAPADAPKTEIAQGPSVTGSTSSSTAESASAGEKEVARDEDSALGGYRPPSPAAPVLSKDKNEVDGVDSKSGVADLSTGRAQSERESNLKNTNTTSTPANKPQPSFNEEQTAGARKRAAASRRSESQPRENAAGATLDDRAGREDKANKLEERRSVGGRQFVRRGNAWVDTAYRAQATTNIRRGTEQYRSLAADEPGLRNIAAQFDGEVVIVWKGRAYRIR